MVFPNALSNKGIIGEVDMDNINRKDIVGKSNALSTELILIKNKEI